MRCGDLLSVDLADPYDRAVVASPEHRIHLPSISSEHIITSLRTIVRIPISIVALQVTVKSGKRHGQLQPLQDYFQVSKLGKKLSL